MKCLFKGEYIPAARIGFRKDCWHQNIKPSLLSSYFLLTHEQYLVKLIFCFFYLHCVRVSPQNPMLQFSYEVKIMVIFFTCPLWIYVGGVTVSLFLAAQPRNNHTGIIVFVILFEQ